MPEQGPVPGPGVGNGRGAAPGRDDLYARLFGDGPVAMYICDLHGTVLDANAALCAMLGTLRDDVVGRTMASFALSPSLRAEELAPFVEGRVGTYSTLRTYKGADGRALRAMVTLGAVRDGNGRALVIYGRLEDLGARDLASGDHDHQRRRLEMAIEASGIGVWELDVRSGRVTLQEQAPGSARFSEQTMTYGDFVRTFHADDRRRLPSIRSLRSRDPGEVDLELRSGAGPEAQRWVHVKGRAVCDETGEVLQVTGTRADVTEPRARRAELAAQRDRLELALETARMTAWQATLGPYASFSALRADLLGLELSGPVPVSGLLACPVFGDRVLPADRDAVSRGVRLGLRSAGDVLDIEYRWQDDDGRLRWLHTRARYDDQEGCPTVTGTSADVTAARAEVAARLRAEGVLTRTLEASQDAFIGLDAEGLVTDWNPASEALFGWFRDEVLGLPLAGRVFPQDAPVAEVLGGAGPRWPERRATAMAEGGLRQEMELLTRDGRRFPAEVSAVRVVDDGMVLVRLFVRDLSERKAYEGQLVRSALFDPLTGLPNRALLLDRLSSAVRRLGRAGGLLAVLFIDVDRFKHINDSIGHTAGDEFLVQFGQRVRSVVRPSDTVARLGADEFVVVCEGLDDEREALAVAARTEAVLATPFVLGERPPREVYASAAVGVAMARDAAVEAEALVRDAGTAMHRAKEHGGGHAEVFDAEIRRRSIAHFETESELRRAMERGELSLYYQPVVDLTGRLEKVEALVRWVRPSGKVALPAEFVPLAEETGLIVPLGEVVLQMACEQVVRWRNEHSQLSELGVAVNVSSVQLRSPASVDRMAGIIRDGGLPPGALILEITESVLMDERSGAANRLADLRELGVRLAVDDFGTGYSSLLYLRRYPLDMLKIDRSFVAGLADNAEDATIVDAVVRLGHSFGLQTVAEGVETVDQLKLLRSLGCDLGQGHFWGRPLPPETVLSLLLAEQGPGSR